MTTAYKSVTLTCEHTVVVDVVVTRGREKFHHCGKCKQWRKTKSYRPTAAREKAAAPPF